MRYIIGGLAALVTGWACMALIPASSVASEPKARVSVQRVLATPISERGLAKHEPAKGCYLGAYIELDPSINKKLILDGRGRRDPATFEKIVGKPHASYFFYMGYGRPLPFEYVKALKDRGNLIQIALEPNAGLTTVQEDDYLISLADAMGASKARIFLRFASEMNGDWVRYHGDPKLYIEKWRLVHRVMAERAPNVAMVWCPYAMPLTHIDAYYPGDAYVDWVGINMYNVTYFNQNKSTPAHHIGPFDLLDPIYRKYADRKPIMIAEYGVTHYSAVENRNVRDFAVVNIDALYQGIRKRYPKVKAIYYFNTNGLALKHRRNNDYRVTTEPKVRAIYQRSIDHPHFLSGIPAGLESADQFAILTLEPGQVLTRPVVLSADTQPSASTVRFKWSYYVLPQENGQAILDPAELGPGFGELTVEAIDESGAVVGSRKLALELRPANREP